MHLVGLLALTLLLLGYASLFKVTYLHAVITHTFVIAALLWTIIIIVAPVTKVSYLGSV